MLELVTKLEAVLFVELAGASEWPEYQLLVNLKRFTLLVHQSEFGKQDIIKLNNLAEQIVKACQKLQIRPESSEVSQVWCKLHHLTHYGDMVSKFGPPYMYRYFTALLF